jgi:hypothetical protein
LRIWRVGRGGLFRQLCRRPGPMSLHWASTTLRAGTPNPGRAVSRQISRTAT